MMMGELVGSKSSVPAGPGTQSRHDMSEFTIVRTYVRVHPDAHGC